MGKPFKRMTPREKAAQLREQLAELAEQAEPKRLTEEEAKGFLALSREEINVLNLIAAGRPPRNAMAIMAAIRLKLEHTVSKPKQNVGVDSEVHVTIETVGDENHGDQ
jgi:hypothetical protein